MHGYGDLTCRVVTLEHGLHHLIAGDTEVIKRLVRVLLQLISETPHHYRWRVAVAGYPLFDVMSKVVEERHSSTGMLAGPFVVELINYQYSVFVAELDEVAAIGIVRSADMIHAELLHQLDTLLDGTRIGSCSEGS